MKALGLDVGGRRIGVAVSDPGGSIAFPLRALTRRGDERDLQAVLALVREQGAGCIVVGLPYSLDGSLGPQGREVLAFYQALKERSPVPVEVWDERLSTAEAERRMREAGRKPSREREALDALSAAVILQSYLDAHREGKEEGW